MPALDAIEFGPFTTTYHRELVTDLFKEEVRRFITDYLVPQVDHDIAEIDGSIVSRANEEENCGPNSAVRNCFYLSVRFFGQSESDYSQIETQLWYRPSIGLFEVATGSSLYVWTPERRRKRESEKASIQVLMDSIQNQKAKSLRCPICGSHRLNIVTSKGLFLVDRSHPVSCASGCFLYDTIRIAMPDPLPDDHMLNQNES